MGDVVPPEVQLSYERYRKNIFDGRRRRALGPGGRGHAAARSPRPSRKAKRTNSCSPIGKTRPAAKSLEISSVDDTTGKLHDFKVAEIDGQWVIPSHSNYPANAEQNVVNVASSLINLKILDVVSDSQGEQETYGVVEPSIKLAARRGRRRQAGRRAGWRRTRIWPG